MCEVWVESCAGLVGVGCSVGAAEEGSTTVDLMVERMELKVVVAPGESFFSSVEVFLLDLIQEGPKESEAMLRWTVEVIDEGVERCKILQSL